MKKWIIGAALLVFTSLQVVAQQGKREQVSPEERAKKATEIMAVELELSKDQKSQILDLNLEQAKQRQIEMDREMELRKKRSEEMKVHQEKIQSILTEEQRTKWEELKSEQRDKRRFGGYKGQGRNEMSRQGRGN